MKRIKRTQYITIIVLAVLIVVTTIAVLVRANTTEIDSSSVSEEYFIPLDATEEELLAYALGDIYEMKAGESQEDLGILDNWEGQYSGKPLAIEVKVGNSRNLTIYTAYYGAIESLEVAASDGTILSSMDIFRGDGTIRLQNVAADTYRIEVKRYENNEVKVVCRVFGEITTPEVTLPELLPTKSVNVKNEYGVDMEIELPTGKHIIPAKSDMDIPLEEGPNNGKLKLIDDNLSSESIDVYTWADTTPPQISVEKAFEDDRASVAYVVNLLSDEPLKEMKINGEPVMVIGSDRDIGNEKLIYSHVVYVDKVTDIITIEATDLIGNHSTTKIVTAELDIGPVP